MKKNLFLLAIVTLFIFSGCQNKSDAPAQPAADSLKVSLSDMVKTDNSVPRDSVTGDEIFEDFWLKFSADEHFQISRIKYPLHMENVESIWEVKSRRELPEGNLILSDIKPSPKEYKLTVKGSDAQAMFYVPLKRPNVKEFTYRFKLVDHQWYIVWAGDFLK